MGQSAQKMRRRKPQVPKSNHRETWKLEDWNFFGAWCLGFGICRGDRGTQERICSSRRGRYFSRLMPKPISRSKTRKAVAKRFKITARGKILRTQSSRRHLLASKRAKRKRQLGKMARVDRTDEARVKLNLPFG